MKQDLKNFRRIVVKIGSALLVDKDTGTLREAWLQALAEDIARLAGTGAEILIVSSGAIALGRRMIGLAPGKLRLEESQAAAAAGQITLSHAWKNCLGAHEITTAQVLLTLGDTEERRRYLNARNTIATLLKLGVVPIINENDTVATSEIRYGDNDRLAARVASMISADLLILLSDVDGLYTEDPRKGDGAFIPVVERITETIESSAGETGTELSRGGMKTKIDAAKIAVAAGAHMIITNGHHMHPLHTFEDSERGTWFIPAATPVAARKKWIAGALEPNGAIVIDDGAIKALDGGKSLLPAGVTDIFGEFLRGDAVIVRGQSGVEIGRGLSAYDAGEAKRIAGARSGEIETLLGYAGRPELIHRDDLVLKQD